MRYKERRLGRQQGRKAYGRQKRLNRAGLEAPRGARLREGELTGRLKVQGDTLIRERAH